MSWKQAVEFMRIKVAKDMKRRQQLCVSVAGRSVACSWTERQREQDPSAIEARSLERIDQDKQCCSGRRHYEHWRLGWRSECEGLFFFYFFIFWRNLSSEAKGSEPN